jgi:hypothetical protein
MQKDILEKIETDFQNPEKVINILKAMESMNRGPISDRAYRGIIFLAQGSMTKLNHYIELSFKDYRDLMWQAEHVESEVQNHDFNKSFSELGL